MQDNIFTVKDLSFAYGKQKVFGRFGTYVA